MHIGGAAPKRYYCHQCKVYINFIPPPDGEEVCCPRCDGGFIEELDCESPNPKPNLNPNHDLVPLFIIPRRPRGPFLPSPSPNPSPVPLLPPRAVSIDLWCPGDVSALLRELWRLLDPSLLLVTSTDPNPFNPVLFLQNHLQGLMNVGAITQVVIIDSGGNGRLGNYFIGPGLLEENDPNRYGTPPASRPAVESLADVEISPDMLASDESQCTVCMEAFKVGVEPKQMPCGHIFHKDCIIPWLSLNNSCPVCRYKLPTDDPDHNQQSEAPSPAGTGAVGVFGWTVEVAAGAPASRRTEWRFRVLLPSQFRARELSLDPSGNSDGGNSGGEGGGDQ